MNDKPKAPLEALGIEPERLAFEDMFSEGGRWPKAIERNAEGNYILMSAHQAWTYWKRGWDAATAAHVAACNRVADEAWVSRDKLRPPRAP